MMCNESDNNPHVKYDDNDCSTVTFLGVSLNSSLGSEEGGERGQSTLLINGNGFHFDT